jgi:arylsulfatase
MLGSRAIYHDGWKAVTFKPLGRMYSPDDDPDLPFDDDVWELFHVAEDFSESHDRAATEPDRLRDLVARWWSEAERYQVLPLDNRPYLAIMEPPPTGIPHRTRFVYRPGGARVPEEVAANVKGRSHRIDARVEIPEEGGEGVLLAQGSVFGGYSLYVQDGRLHYVHNYLGREEHHLASGVEITPGPHTLTFAFDSDGLFQGGQARLEIDGIVAATAGIPRFTPVRFSITDAGLTCGADTGSPVTTRYDAPFEFTGTVRDVVVTVEGAALGDPDAPVDAPVDASIDAAVDAALAEQ